ncbi:glycosyltransferase [candidate division KSB1 bacterium]|nr:glycosyltransferase [candidate division KSB1 bacterium]
MNATNQNQSPALSVILPSRDRLEVLQQVLSALESQYRHDPVFEVVVVDDDSADDTYTWLRDFEEKSEMPIHAFRVAVHNAGICRNFAVSHALGEYLLFLDADTLPNPGLVVSHLEFHRRPPAEKSVLMGGIIMADELQNTDQVRFIKWEIRTDKDAGRSQVDWSIYRTGNTSVSRSLFQEAGGFQTDFVEASLEDTELAYRLWKSGAKFYHDARIRAVHYHPMSLPDYLHKARIFGENAAKWYQKNPELRRALTKKYGVFAPEMPLLIKCKYILRAICVNRHTVPFLLGCGNTVRNRVWRLSQRLYGCAYRYTIRKTFRQSLAARR